MHLCICETNLPHHILIAALTDLNAVGDFFHLFGKKIPRMKIINLLKLAQYIKKYCFPAGKKKIACNLSSVYFDAVRYNGGDVLKAKEYILGYSSDSKLVPHRAHFDALMTRVVTLTIAFTIAAACGGYDHEKLACCCRAVPCRCKCIGGCMIVQP